MLAISRGRLVALSTPFGQRGWFYREWESDGPWKKVRITWRDCPRIAPAFIDNEVRSMGQSWVDQEYNCLFTALEGLVYPEFETCLTDDEPPAAGPGARYVGGANAAGCNENEPGAGREAEDRRVHAQVLQSGQRRGQR